MNSSSSYHNHNRHKTGFFSACNLQEIACHRHVCVTHLNILLLKVMRRIFSPPLTNTYSIMQTTKTLLFFTGCSRLYDAHKTTGFEHTVAKYDAGFVVQTSVRVFQFSRCFSFPKSLAVLLPTFP